MADSVTPMMRQYRRVKKQLSPDIILFFRLGDFYEMFFEDAKRAAPILDIALTKRNKVPMCGVPYHAVDSYLAKLLRAGRKVAICDQVEDASASSGIVKREITRVVTPGTVTEEDILERNRHNFLAGICPGEGTFGLALLDLSVGLFVGEELSSVEALADSLKRFLPSECVLPSESAGNTALRAALAAIPSLHVTPCDDWTFEYEAAHDTLVRHFEVHSLDGFGCEGNNALVGAAGGALFYVREELRRQVGHIRSFQVRKPADFLVIDEATCANLDLVPLRGSQSPITLLKILDVTRTAMGGRKLREWLLRPLAQLEETRKRHDAVQAFCQDRKLLADVRDALDQIRDLERLVGRIGSGRGNARDLVAVGRSLRSVPTVRALVKDQAASLFIEVADALHPLPELADLIERAIVDEPPATTKEGGLIRQGYDRELDDLHNAATEGRKWLAEYQALEQKRAGIRTLKVRHNKVFGYYIEVSKGQVDNVPEDYVRKQTLVNAERFITPELKEYENRIVSAHEKSLELEMRVFLEVKDAAVAETARIQVTAEALAQLDVLAALAERALALRYVRPEIGENESIRIKDGRHPVIEQIPDAERFVPNDTTLDCSQNQLIVITGPNMAGKSTYIRQVALIVIMAQMGSFVPAREAKIGLVDKIFTRVGASDDLTRGRSTFLVEMQETANILNNATPSSLIVLDEIGRGTSTFDGISIAWAVAEHLHNNERVKAKTLFATHYHELTELMMTMPGVKNYNVLVKERNDRIVFLRKIVPGGSDKSYGIQVARLAGLPPEVIERSKEILANLEEGELGDSGQPKIAKRRMRKEEKDSSQMQLFEQGEQVEGP